MDDTAKEERPDRLVLCAVCPSPLQYGCDHRGHELKNDRYLLSLTNTVDFYPLSDTSRSGDFSVLSSKTAFRTSDRNWSGLPQTRIPRSILILIADAVGHTLSWISDFQIRGYSFPTRGPPPFSLTFMLHTQDMKEGEDSNMKYEVSVGIPKWNQWISSKEFSVISEKGFKNEKGTR